MISSKRRRAWVSLRVKYNPETGEVRGPAFIEIARDEYIQNPILDLLNEPGPRPGSPPMLTIIDGGTQSPPA